MSVSDICFISVTHENMKKYFRQKLYYVERDMLSGQFFDLEITMDNLPILDFYIKVYIFCCIFLQVMSKHQTFKIVIKLLLFINIYCVINSNSFCAIGISVIQYRHEESYIDNPRTETNKLSHF